MKEDQFDDVFRGKLRHLQAGRPDDAWELFEQKLDTPESGVPQPDETIIDQIVFDKLHRYEAVRPNSGWHLLRHRMNAQMAITYRVASWKATEAVLLSLLILLLTYLPLPQKTLPHQPIAGATPDVSDAATGRDSYVPTSIPVPPAQPAPTELPTREKTPPSLPSAAASVEDITASPSAAYPEITRLPARTAPPVASITQATPTLSGIPSLESGAAKKQRSAPLIDGPIPTSRVESNQPLFTWSNPVQSIKPSYLHVGMYGDIAYNRVITPPNSDMNITGFDRYTLGYGGGVLLGIKKGAFEIGSGMAYHAIRYEPIPLLVTRGFFNQGYTTEKFDFVELNVLSIPLYVQYDLIQETGWRFYATAGTSFNVAYETNFYAVFPEEISLPSGLRPTPRRQSTFGNRYGWLEGGSLRENSFFTLNFGFGLERTFTGRWSMFLQPTYLHNLGYYSQGMGPTRDRIHSMSILTGVRVRVER